MTASEAPAVERAVGNLGGLGRKLLRETIQELPAVAVSRDALLADLNRWVGSIAALSLEPAS